MTEKTVFLKKVKIKHVLLLLFFIFSVKFSFLPINTGRLVAFYCILALLIFYRKQLLFPYNRDTINTFSLLVLYGLYTAISTLNIGGTNLSNLINIVIIVFQITITSYLIASFFIQEDLDQLLFLILIILGVQGILIFVNFVFPTYREFMFTIMPVEGNITEDNFTSAFRTRGIMQSSGAAVSAFLAVGFLIGAYFLSSFDLSKDDRKVTLLCLPWILIGIVFTGRTGFVMIPLALCLYYVLLVVTNRFKFKSLLILLYLPLTVMFTYRLIIYIYIYIHIRRIQH